MTIVGANTALTVRQAEQRFGRTMTENDVERLDACNGAQCRARPPQRITSRPSSPAYRISRALSQFMATLRRIPRRRPCARRRCGSASSTRCRSDLSHIGPTLRRYMPGTSMFNISGQPAMSVPLAWSKAGLPLGMMFAAALRRRRHLVSPWRHSSSRSAPGGPSCRRSAPESWLASSLFGTRTRQNSASFAAEELRSAPGWNGQRLILRHALETGEAK